jgi:hypothetical protein
LRRRGGERYGKKDAEEQEEVEYGRHGSHLQLHGVGGELMCCGLAE